MRISIADYMMDMAELAAERSTCPRRKVGAVLARSGAVLSTGYNGAPRGFRHCDEEESRCRHAEKCEVAVHAEVNAIAQAARLGVSTEMATLYVSCLPCYKCMGVVVNAGISAIYYAGRREDLQTREIALMSRVKLEMARE